jgi:uncharacterized protein YuzE
MFERKGRQPEPRLRRDDENGLAYLYLSEVGPGQAVTQRTVALSDDEDAADLVLDFDSQGRLLGIEFLSQPHLPPDW